MRNAINLYRQKPKNLELLPDEAWAERKIHYGEHKEDGHRLTIFRDTGGTLRAVGRQTHIDKWPHIERHFLECDLSLIREGDAYDGEIYAVGGSNNDATQIMAGIYAGEVRFTSWGKFLERGQPIKFTREWNRKIVEEVGFRAPTLVKEHLVTGAAMLKYIAREQIEGLVWKWKPFGRTWYKFKPVATTDLIVTNVHEGQGKFSGTLGSVSFSDRDGREWANVGQWSDELRRLIWAAPQVYAGRVAEIAYKDVQKSRLIHPRFVRWRDDKPAEECYVE